MTELPSEPALLAIAREAAMAGAAEVGRRFGSAPEGVRSKSTPTDLVSEADVAAEAAIRAVLARERPGDAVLGEEGGATPGDGALRWIVDPLDGTVNYLYGIPVFGVSVACEDGAGTVAGVVLDPVRDECFAATRSGPATRDGLEITASDCAVLATAMVATGFAYDAVVRVAQARVASRVIPAARDIRRAGAASIDLCWCACGRVDAYYERGIRVWDYAAGALICSRAGLVVRRLEADGVLPDGLVVAPAGLIDELATLVASS